MLPLRTYGAVIYGQCHIRQPKSHSTHPSSLSINEKHKREEAWLWEGFASATSIMLFVAAVYGGLISCQLQQ